MFSMQREGTSYAGQSDELVSLEISLTQLQLTGLKVSACQLKCLTGNGTVKGVFYLHFILQLCYLFLSAKEIIKLSQFAANDFTIYSPESATFLNMKKLHWTDLNFSWVPFLLQVFWWIIYIGVAEMIFQASIFAPFHIMFYQIKQDLQSTKISTDSRGILISLYDARKTSHFTISVCKVKSV